MAGQESSASKHGFRSPDDVDNAPLAPYRDVSGRRYRAEDDLLVDFDSVEEYRAGRSAAMQPREGQGVLDVFVCTSRTADATGVLVLNGRPIAAGDGRYQVELPPGTYSLDVQGADATTAEFELAPGERVCFTTGYSVSVAHQVEYRTQLYRVQDGTDYLPMLDASELNRSGIGCLVGAGALAVLLVAGLLTVFLPEGTWTDAASVVTAVSALTLVGSVVANLLVVRRLHRRAESKRIEPVHRSAENGAIAFPSPEDLRTWHRRGTPLGVAVVFDLFFYRLTREADGAVVYTGSSEALALAHAGRPRLWIDGAEVPCDWSTWYYPLSAGEHRFTVEYGPEPDGSTVRHDFSHKVVDTDDISVLQVPIRVFRIWDERQQRLTALPPQAADRVSKKARYAVTRMDGRKSGDFWHPPRLWPAPGESQV